jgi:hypothetical protein
MLIIPVFFIRVNISAIILELYLSSKCNFLFLKIIYVSYKNFPLLFFVPERITFEIFVSNSSFFNILLLTHLSKNYSSYDL